MQPNESTSWAFLLSIELHEDPFDGYKLIDESLQHDIDIVLHFCAFCYDDIPEAFKNDERVLKKTFDNTHITYFWYHGFYTAQQQITIRKALNEKDYDSFMKMYNLNRRGLPEEAAVFDENEDCLRCYIDITQKDNFLRITYEDSEAG